MSQIRQKIDICCNFVVASERVRKILGVRAGIIVKEHYFILNILTRLEIEDLMPLAPPPLYLTVSGPMFDAIIVCEMYIFRLLLSSWGLPREVLVKYAEAGIERMFEWQADCLCTGNVLGK